MAVTSLTNNMDVSKYVSKETRDVVVFHEMLCFDENKSGSKHIPKKSFPLCLVDNQTHHKKGGDQYTCLLRALILMP